MCIFWCLFKEIMERLQGLRDNNTSVTSVSHVWDFQLCARKIVLIQCRENTKINELSCIISQSAPVR